MAKYRTYKKDLEYSYTLGVFLTIELLEAKPKQVETVIISTKTSDTDGYEKIEQLCRKHHIPIEVNDKLMDILSPKENCYAIGIFNKYEERLHNDAHHVVLVNPSDSGNLGTILRTALGFGLTEIAMIKPATDIFDPKTVRASMGALFQMKFRYFPDFASYEREFGNRDLYPFMLQAKFKLKNLKRETKKPYSLIFGNEARGLDASFLNVGTSLIIPHSNRIDSLNLSAAASIAIYEFTKNNSFE